MLLVRGPLLKSTHCLVSSAHHTLLVLRQSKQRDMVVPGLWPFRRVDSFKSRRLLLLSEDIPPVRGSARGVAPDSTELLSF